MGEALFAIDLAEKAIAAVNFRAVLLVVSGLLVREHISKWRIGAESQATNFIVHLTDRPELPGEINVGFDVHRREPVGKLSGLFDPIIALHMLS